jgi:hypothetical protein
MRLGLLLALSVVTSWAKADERLMQPMQVNNLILSGAEYWPFIGAEEFQYPDQVLWGFYPEAGVPPPGEVEPNPDSATPLAIACAEQAYRKLQEFFHNPHPLFARVLERGATQLVTPKFYLWTNDYSRAANPYPHGVRPARLWYWKRNPQVEGRTPGYWKWESTVLQDGTCQIPGDEQIDEYVREYLQSLG